MNPLISIIIPAFNIEQYIERCLDSVIVQTYKNIEIIVVDDGSTDGTRKIIESYVRKDQRIQGIYKKNGGVSSARNQGIERARGDYIGFVDGDDMIESDMYEFLIDNAIKYGADISHCGYQMVFPDRTDPYYGTGELRLQTNKTGLIDLLKGDPVEPGLCNKLYKRNLFLDITIDINIHINEDLLMNYYLFSKSEKAVFQDEMKYHYMRRDGSATSRTLNENKLLDPSKVLKIMMRKENIYSEINNIIFERYLRQLINLSTLYSIKYKKLINSNRKKARKELKFYLKNKEKMMEIHRKIKYMAWMAGYFPVMWRVVKELHLLRTGQYKKYRVRRKKLIT